MIARELDFLSKAELEIVNSLIARLNTENGWANSGSGSDRIFPLDTLLKSDFGFGKESDVEVLNTFINIRFKVKRYINLLRWDLNPLHPESLLLVRWLPGDEQQPHSDCETFSDAPHPYPWRTQASLIYVNDNFEGGYLYFPQKHIEIKPRAGSLVTFTGNNDYLHGVTEVTSGVRYTIASFWTEDDSQRDSLPA